MQVVKATKLFRQVSIILSMIMAIGSVATVAAHKNTCSSDIQVAVGLVSAMWIIIFILLLLQVIGMVKFLKEYPKSLFVFYFIVVGCMYVSMMMLFGGSESDCNSVTPVVCCRVKAPAMWYWLIINVCLFYLICAFGLASWG